MSKALSSIIEIKKDLINSDNEFHQEFLILIKVSVLNYFE
jgi:hypothetical protein